MGRLLLTALLLAGSGCIDWGSLYAEDDGGVGEDADQPAIDAAPSAVGCSDGTAEVLLAEGGLAACDGAWSIPGVVNEEPPACHREAGNDGPVPSGDGCNVSDLCAVGWHVCTGAADVSAHGGDNGCSDLKPPDPDGGDAYIYLTRQGGRGDETQCSPDGSTDGSDDAWGCGTLGLEAINCLPLDRHLALGDAGGCGTSFDCGEDPAAEGLNVRKLDQEKGGGVLCCTDAGP